MRIAYVITGLERGGAETQLSRLARGMHHKHAVIVFSLTAGGAVADELKGAGVPVVLLHAKPWNVLRKLRRGLHAFNPDVVHSFLWHANMAARFAAPKGAKVVSSLRINEQSATRSLLDRMTRSRVHHFTTNSKYVATHSNLPLKRTTVIYNGVPESFWKGKRRKPVPRTAFSAMHLRREKDYGTLLKAAAELREWKFLCAGIGPRKKEIERRIRTERLDNVELLGMRSDIDKQLLRATCLVHLSFAEGMPNTIIEAMLLGTPVIASDIPEIRELAGKRGILIQSQDHEALARAMLAVREPSTATTQWARKTFSLERMTRAHDSLYRSLTSAKHL